VVKRWRDSLSRRKSVRSSWVAMELKPLLAELEGPGTQIAARGTKEERYQWWLDN